MAEKRIQRKNVFSGKRKKYRLKSEVYGSILALSSLKSWCEVSYILKSEE